MNTAYRALCKSLEQKYSGQPGQLLLGDGNPVAKVAVVGFQPDGDEKKVFSGPHSDTIRHVIGDLGVPSYLIWYTYVVKQSAGSVIPVWKNVSPWVDVLFEELSHLRNRATILLGIESAWAVLGLDEPNIDNLRKKRFTHNRAPHTNFFVTYSPDDIIHHGRNSEVGSNHNFDLMGVFEVQEEYYKHHVLLK